MRSNNLKQLAAGRRAVLGTAAIFAACSALAGTAAAQTGGTGTSGGTTTTSPSPSSVPWRTVPGNRGKITKKHKAIPPRNAPYAIQQAIVATNAIRKRPYVYGGGHASFYTRGYDCSGTVSYLLHYAGVLDSPMPSGSFMSWAEPGKGRWLTVFANKGHMYAKIAGLRLDTSAAGERGRPAGKGPRWRRGKRKPRGFVRRHPAGF